MNEAELRLLASEYGYVQLAFCSPAPFKRWENMRAGAHKTAQRLCSAPLERAPWAKALCVAAAPYPLYKAHEGVSVAAYYVAYNAAHECEGAFVRALNARGVQAQALDIPAKPAAERSGLGRYGKNGLIHIPELGGCVMLMCMALGEGFECAGEYPALDECMPDDCGSCRRCMDACPAGALSEQGFDHTRCLRSHMMQGPPVPEQLREHMGGRLLGCEECLRACPRNAVSMRAALDAPPELERVLDIVRALAPDTRGEYMREFGELLGWNLAIPNRVLAQALIVAANLNRIELLPHIEPLVHSASAAVSEHARWAVNKLAEKQKAVKEDG